MLERRRIHQITLILVCLLYGISSSSIAQIQVASGDEAPFTPVNLIKNVFLGDGVKVLDLQYEGDSRSIGKYENGQNIIGLAKGIVITTGFAAAAESQNLPNTLAGVSSNTSISDIDLENLVEGDTIKDIAKFELTFIPESDSIRFRYVFASEEYPEFVCSVFNDVFGFFISGPNPSGGNYNAKNLALVPDPNDISGQTFTNNIVSINSVNSGTAGEFAEANQMPCIDPQGSLNFAQYYNEVAPNAYPVYDGYLDVFIALAHVVPCEEYTIKIAIGDRKDTDFDSAVFLEANSFESNVLKIDLNTVSIDGSIAEGCSEVELGINLPRPVMNSTVIDISTFPSGSFPDQAIEGVDFNTLPGQILIPAGQSSTSLTLTALEDNEVEEDEFIYLLAQRSICEVDTLKIRVRDRVLNQVMLPEDLTICDNDLIQLIPSYDPPIEQQDPPRFVNSTNLQLENEASLYTSSIFVNGVSPLELGSGLINRICIDTLVARDLSTVDIYLEAPDGQLLELSTDNGSYPPIPDCINIPSNPICIDTFLNTCFTIDAALNINNGNASQGPSFVGNRNYTGEYLPEGEWDVLFVEGAQSNGEWNLNIILDEQPILNDALAGNFYLGQWSIEFNPLYDIVHHWSPNYNIQCTECDEPFASPDLDVTYQLEAVDSYGCETSDDIRVTVNESPEIPVIIDCQSISPSSILINWEDVQTDFDFYDARVVGIASWFQTQTNQILFGGLVSDTEYEVLVRTFNGDCFSRTASILCSTLPCEGNVPTFLSANAFAPSCPNGTDGRIEVEGIAEEGGPLTYYLNNQINQTGVFENVPAGAYTIRLVDNEGCGNLIEIEVPPADALNFNTLLGPISCTGESDGSIMITNNTNFNPPYLIAWEGGSSEFLIENLTAGTYNFTVTDSEGCEFIEDIVLEDPPPLTFEQVNSIMPDCFGGQGNIEIVLEGGTGNYTYAWKDSSEDGSSFANFPGNYELTVTDGNGCTSSTAVEILERLEIEIIEDIFQVVCNDEITGNSPLNIQGGVAPFNVTGLNQDALAIGQYNITITDANNCSVEEYIEIVNYPDVELIFQMVEPNCFNTMDGVLSIEKANYSNGDELDPIDIVWEGGETTEVLGNLLGSRHYRYTITDDFGCTHEDFIFLEGPPEILSNLDTLSELSCFEDNNASFQIFPSGGFGDLEYNWSSNIPTTNDNIAADLAAGIYGLTITDESNCALEEIIEVTEPAELLFQFESMDIDCFGETNGSIMGQITGGTPPYILNWDTGESNDTLIDLATGIYNLEIEDFNGCQFLGSIEIIAPAQQLDVTYVANETKCYLTKTGSIDIFAFGGTPPYNYFLNGSDYFDTSLIGSLEAGFYNLRVEDVKGCFIEIDQIEIIETNKKEIELGDDVIVDFGATYVIEFETNIVDFQEFAWSTIPPAPFVELLCYDCIDPIVESVTTNFTLILDVKDSNDCKFHDEKKIEVVDESTAYVPTGFSPDGNGRNDVLFVLGKDGVVITEFEIYDRWGELLFRDQDFPVNTNARGWDGNYKGDPMEAGVYMWKIAFVKQNGEARFQEGSVTLLR